MNRLRTISAQTLPWLLTLAIAIPPPRAWADVAPALSMATSTLEGINGALGDLSGVFNIAGSNNAQLAAMAQQLSQVRFQQNGAQTQQSAFDQIHQKLTAAMTQANSCVAQASTANYDKYVAKRPTAQKTLAKNLTPDALTSVEPTCSTYGVILDSIELNKAKLTDANKKMSCLTNFQNSVSQIADAAKAPFQQLNNTATEVQKTYSQIIDAHTKMADKIASDLDGPADKDGKRSGGYRDQLAHLKSMALELNNVFNARQGALATEGDANKAGLKYGLVKAVENLKQQRVSAANTWYYTMMSDVESCYHSQPAASCYANDVGNSLSPDQCVASVVNDQGNGTNSAGQRARAHEDSAALDSIGIKNYFSGQKINLPANIDVSKPDQFLSFTGIRFQSTLAGVLGAYNSHKFATGVDKGAITQYIQNSYQACYDKAVTNFKADMISKGGTYYSQITAMQDIERETANDEKNWIDRVEQQMTDFRTSFQKTYNSDLAQFKTDCTDGGDPYKGLDCLRVLSAQMQSGIRGTTNTVKLSNGTSYTVQAGNTVLPVQTLTLDAQGKPTIGSSSVTCSGFDDCVTYLSNARDQHAGAADQSTQDRQKFVDQHNAAVKQAFQSVGAQFSQVTALLVAGVGGINQDLAALGVKASMKTKQIDPEDLTNDDATGLIKMPKSMKAALAGQTAYSEIDDNSTQSVTDAFNTLLGDLNKKAADAQKQKRLCEVDASDYKRLNGVMPTCENTAQICSRDRVAQAAGVLDPILRRSRVQVEENSSSKSSSSNSDYRNCMNDAKQASQQDLEDDDKLEEFAQGMNPPIDIYQTTEGSGKTIDPQKRAQVRNKMRASMGTGARGASKDSTEECSAFILNALNAEADQGRNTLKQQNNDIISALQGVEMACSSTTKDSKGNIQEDSDVGTACENFKKVVGAVNSPTGEAETGVAGKAGNTASPSTNPFNGTAAPAQ